MVKKFAIAAGFLALLGVGGAVSFNSSRIDFICHIFANCQSFKEPYDIALILNRDAQTGLANSVNIDDLRRVYELAEKSSNAVSLAKIPSNYADTNTLNSRNKELLSKVGDRINQEEKAEIYLKQAQDKATEADTLSAASLVRINKSIQRINEASAAFNEQLDREAVAFRLQQASRETGIDYSLPDFRLLPRGINTSEVPEPEKELSKEEERKQQSIEYTKALSLYKESLKLVESIPNNSFVDDKKILLLKKYRDEIYSTERFINLYLPQSKNY